MLDFVVKLPRPRWTGERVFGALSHPEEYAVDEGKWCTTTGLALELEEFTDCVEEYQVPHSNALHCRLKDGSRYMVGPLARLNLNFERLAPAARYAALQYNIRPPELNPYGSMVARVLEIFHAVDACLDYLSGISGDNEEISYEIRGGEDCSIVEAPRGTLSHHPLRGTTNFVEKYQGLLIFLAGF